MIDSIIHFFDDFLVADFFALGFLGAAGFFVRGFFEIGLVFLSFLAGFALGLAAFTGLAGEVAGTAGVVAAGAGAAGAATGFLAALGAFGFLTLGAFGLAAGFFD